MTLRAFILEDEAPASARLQSLLEALDPPCQVVGRADSVASAGRWLLASPPPDLIFADIQLGDGLSLDLFRSQPPPCPVVFTTAHDEYLLEAFASHGIAYLLKPVKPAALAAAVQKYRELGRHYAGNLVALAARLAPPPARRQRVLAQRGSSFQPIALSEVAYFLSEHKLTFLVTRSGEKCLVNEPLGGLADELDPAQFFRLNRNYLARASAVKSFASVGKGRLEVQLQPRPSESVVVSQENGAAFRAWVER
ncbi:MAG: response regulator transcription factor [Verrucomicrobia bacterium]|nr:response regulator transcription factor [Verrucomicrobiota bacterium]